MSKLIFLVALTNDNSYQREQANAAKQTADRLGVDVRIVHANDDFMTQGQQLMDAIHARSAPRPDGILFEPLTGTGHVRVAETAVAAGIPWVVLNCDMDYVGRLRERAKAPVFVVTRDHIEIGRVQSRQFAALLPDGGSVLYIQGPSMSEPAKERTQGMESTLSSGIRSKQIRSQWTEKSAYEAVSGWLRLPRSRAADYDLVGCQYDGIAMGARRAFDEKTKGADRDRWLSLPFTGVDGLVDEGQAWVDQGLLTATVIAPTTTERAMELLSEAIIKGVQPAARTVIDSSSYPSLEELKSRGAKGST